MNPILETLEQAILKSLGNHTPKSLAGDVLRLSDFYIDNPDKPTPWTESWAQRAYLAYFLPLNLLRSLRVYEKGNQFGFFHGVEELVDYGSGLGSGSLPFADADYLQRFVEIHPRAREMHESLLKSLPRGSRLQSGNLGDRKWSSPGKVTFSQQNRLLIQSYALTETQALHSQWEQFTHLMIIEPSTQQDGRRLMQIRSEMIQAGFHIWAPCTHQNACPLLTQSKTDWCHDRVEVELWDWWKEMETHLPMKNETITLSYILARKEPPPHKENWGRIVGDDLIEKGKTRQLICRGPEREYFAWLHRNHPEKNSPWKRGDLLSIENPGEKKGNELREPAVISIKTE